jgi:hypothetical protein
MAVRAGVEMWQQGRIDFLLMCQKHTGSREPAANAYLAIWHRPRMTYPLARDIAADGMRSTAGWQMLRCTK